MSIVTNKKTYQIFLLAYTLLSRFSIMYWKLGGHENMIVLLGLNHVKQALPKWRPVR
jgi:hypothetical protein